MILFCDFFCRLAFKQEYEKFKMFNTILMMVLSIISLIFNEYQYVIYQFHLSLFLKVTSFINFAIISQIIDFLVL